MNVQQIINKLIQYFDTKDKHDFYKESGITYDAGLPVSKVGYATNLTPEVIELAKENNINFILTHHDAWHFIYGLKDRCSELLKEYSISHYFNHLPLDDAEFGTNSSMARELGFNVIKKVNDVKGYMCGVIAETDNPIEFEPFVELVESKLDEKILAWDFNDRPISRIHILCGAGHLTGDMKTAVDECSDLYLTGEKILDSVEYAKLHGINLVVGSHTFVELFGVKGMSKLIGLDFPELEIVKIDEPHIEASGIR